MIPPSFSDLGKAAKDIFDKNFKFGKVSLDVKTKSKEGVEMNLKGDHLMKEGKLTGSLEGVHNFEKGPKLTVKWETNKRLLSTLSIQDALADGTKFGVDGTFNPDSGEKSLKTSCSYKAEMINFNFNAEFRNLTPIITKSLVIGCSGTKGYVLGGEISFDTARMALTGRKVAVGYQKKDVALIGSLKNMNDVEALLYQKLNNEIELGVQLKWNRSARDPEFAVGTKYNFDDDSFFKAKVDSSSKVGLAYGFKAKDNVNITLCSELDGKNLESGSHKVGFEFVYSP